MGRHESFGTAAGSKFKVGQRVKWNGMGEDLIDHWMRYWATKGDDRPPFFYVTGITNGGRDITYSTTSYGRGPLCSASYFELAPLFAVGDKVRALSDLPEGKVGTVLNSIDSDNDVLVRFEKFDDGHGVNDDEWYINISELEPVTATGNSTYTSCAAAEVDNLADEYGGGTRGARKPGYRFTAKDRPQPGDRVSIADQGTYTVMDVLANGNVRFTDRPNGYTWLLDDNAAISACTLVQAATAPLTIQAGRYYKTRDGRKVGPMENREDYFAVDGWHYRADGICAYEGGSRVEEEEGEYREPRDLTAEWPSDEVPLRSVSHIEKPVVAPATTAKFKVGDRVVDVSRSAPSGAGKSFGVVKGVGCDTVRVVWERDGTGGEFDWPASDFELVDKPTTMADIVRKHSGTAVVMLIENGQPKPATRPYVHSDRASATTEAERLATTMPGSEFGVYECVDVKKVDKPAAVYDQEWKRLAASGQKINAIRELRSMTGLGLATAKDAVEDWLRREGWKIAA